MTTKTTKTYFLDGAPVDRDEFIKVNDFEGAGYDRDDIVDRIHNLNPGEEIVFGGGASAEFILTCKLGVAHDPLPTGTPVTVTVDGVSVPATVVETMIHDLDGLSTLYYRVEGEDLSPLAAHLTPEGHLWVCTFEVQA